MKSLPKLSRSFQSMTDGQFNQMAQGVISSLTDNALFPDIAGELKKFKTAYDRYFTSIPARNVRSSVNAAIKNTNKETAITAITKLCILVEYQADFNVEVLESSGFELVAKRQSKGLVNIVKNIRMTTNGVDGLVMVSCQRDPNATTYKARVSTDQVNWTWMNAGPSTTVKIYNVPKGVPLYVQMQVENAQGFSPWSEVVTGTIPTQVFIPSIHD